MSMLPIKLRTVASLGPSSLARVLVYRLGLKAGLNPVRRIAASLPITACFRLADGATDRNSGAAHDDAMATVLGFGWHPVRLLDDTFDWHANLITGQKMDEVDRPWWQIADFDSEVGDIKTVWEASRFDWVLQLSSMAAHGSTSALARLNSLLADWCRSNPAYRGPNWKCGQEASIRVMHLAMAALILKQEETPEPALMALVRAHLQRIAPTVMYAMAQDNNHGTSEAAALFIGGSWLHRVRSDAQGARWEKSGRRWLENRARTLIEPDGSFSQYSVNYHRVMLDTYSMAEIWRRRLALPAFSATLHQRLVAATGWLRAFVQTENGDAPNMGANDGARLLALSDEFRDYRPSVQLATVLHEGLRAYEPDAERDRILSWLGIDCPEEQSAEPESRKFDDGGYAVLRKGRATAYLRYPRFRFRPGHADALHLDLWVAGVNWLRDAGTYSYNTEAHWLSYFPGTASHNTIQFDGEDQMPRLSRFLFGDWLCAEQVSEIEAHGGALTFEATYRNRRGHYHRRQIKLSDQSLVVYDDTSGFRDHAVLRWRLKPSHWQLDDNEITNGQVSIKVSTDSRITRIELVEGLESRYYLQKNTLAVLEVELDTSGCIITEFNF